MRPLRIFCSYSHKDSHLRAAVEESFAVMRDAGEIEAWSDGLIRPGQDWANEITQALKDADIVLLLVSRHFLASYYCVKIEVAQALDQSREGKTDVVPIILSTCDFRASSISHLQALPPGGTPLVPSGSAKPSDDRLQEIVEGIREVVEARRGKAVRRRSAASSGRVSATLPHLCDRDQQEIALEPAIEAHLQNTPERPFVCIVHGDIRESHHGFVSRLAESSLPRMLRLRADQPLREVCLQWPPGHESRRAREAFHMYLARSLDCPRHQVTSHLFSIGSAILVRSELLTDDWGDAGPDLTRAYLDFWEQWPNLQKSVILIACLSVRYQGAPGREQPKQTGFQRVLGRWFGQQTAAANGTGWQPHNATETVRKYIKALPLGISATLPGIVLPELEPIPELAARQFGLFLAGNQLLRNRLGDWEREIDSYYEARKTQAIPMAELEPKLALLLEEYAA